MHIRTLGRKVTEIAHNDTEFFWLKHLLKL